MKFRMPMWSGISRDMAVPLGVVGTLKLLTLRFLIMARVWAYLCIVALRARSVDRLE